MTTDAHSDQPADGIETTCAQGAPASRPVTYAEPDEHYYEYVDDLLGKCVFVFVLRRFTLVNLLYNRCRATPGVYINIFVALSRCCSSKVNFPWSMFGSR